MFLDSLLFCVDWRNGSPNWYLSSIYHDIYCLNPLVASDHAANRILLYRTLLRLCVTHYPASCILIKYSGRPWLIFYQINTKKYIFCVQIKTDKIKKETHKYNSNQIVITKHRQTQRSDKCTVRPYTFWLYYHRYVTESYWGGAKFQLSTSNTQAKLTLWSGL